LAWYLVPRLHPASPALQTYHDGLVREFLAGIHAT
jgi:hypothetical protein